MVVRDKRGGQFIANLALNRAIFASIWSTTVVRAERWAARLRVEGVMHKEVGTTADPELEHVAACVRRWLQDVVVGLDLCPWARGPLETGRVRIAVSEQMEHVDVLADLWWEIERLMGTTSAELETTLLVVPFGLADFDEYLDVVSHARDVVLPQTEAVGKVQLATFHPRYEFEGSDGADPANFTNRSPWPILHLLRERSIERVAEAHDDTLAVPRRNARIFRQMPASVLRDFVFGYHVPLA